MAQDEKPKAFPVVRDTQNLSSRDAFELFREIVMNPATPCLLEPRSECDFAARVESVYFENGFFKRVYALPHAAIRTPRLVSKATAEGFLVLFTLSGRIVAEQDGESKMAKQGDLIVLDTAKPNKMSFVNQSDGYQCLVLFAPKSAFSETKALENGFPSPVLQSERLLSSLSSCLSLVSNNLITASGTELHALFNACVSLLPLAAARFDGRTEKRLKLQRDYLFADILDYLHRNLCNSEISPPYVAYKFGISNRYLHKLFAISGTTFSAYITSKRLEHVARDLASSAARDQPIAVVARRWGFVDISTFNKNFKERFGSTPSVFRMRPSYR